MDLCISRARFAVTIFLIVTNDPHYEVLMSAVKTDQSEGTPGAGITEQAVKKMLTGSAALSLPSPFAFFRSLFLNSRFPHSSKLGPLGALYWLLIGREQINDVTGTGSDRKCLEPEVTCFRMGKPLTSGKKGSWAHGNRKSRVLEWETADE